jgi:hypothetical protein
MYALNDSDYLKAEAKRVLHFYFAPEKWVWVKTNVGQSEFIKMIDTEIENLGLQPFFKKHVKLVCRLNKVNYQLNYLKKERSEIMESLDLNKREAQKETQIPLPARGFKKFIANNVYTTLQEQKISELARLEKENLTLKQKIAETQVGGTKP